MKTKLGLIISLILLCAVAFSCGGGGGGNSQSTEPVKRNPNFRITNHQLYMIDINCAAQCNYDANCIYYNCSVPANDKALCVGAGLGWYIQYKNPQNNTKALWYELWKGDTLFEGPVYSPISFSEPEATAPDIIVGVYDKVITYPGAFQIRAWLEDRNGESTKEYPINIRVSNCRFPNSDDSERMDEAQKNEELMKIDSVPLEVR